MFILLMVCVLFGGCLIWCGNSIIVIVYKYCNCYIFCNHDFGSYFEPSVVVVNLVKLHIWSLEKEPARVFAVR